MAGVLEALSISGLIFGGCCSNVFTLEAIVKKEPDSGLLITLLQFILTALAAYPSQATSTGGLKRVSVPFQKWAIIAAMFFGVNMLNNWAFAFKISVPAHIVLRSFGSVTTMGAGWLRGKKYSPLQVLSVMVLTVGVVISAWADAESKGKSTSAKTDDSNSDFTAGLAVLFVAQLLSAYMGVYVQDTYAQYGANWAENLFYSHFLSLPMFLPLWPTLHRQYNRLAATPSIDLPASLAKAVPAFLSTAIERTPSAVVYLTLNAITQLGCITGVNLLSAKSSAVTVTIVLNVRKLVSFMFSIWLFGNHLSGLMVLGSALVFGSGALYGWETTVGIKARKAREEQGKRKVNGKAE